MTNEERRIALAKARCQALKHAEAAQEVYERAAEDGPETILAIMWANVAEAMKDGDPTHDGALNLPLKIVEVEEIR